MASNGADPAADKNSDNSGNDSTPNPTPITNDDKATTEKRPGEEGSPSIKRQKTDTADLTLHKDETEASRPYRRVIAVLPGTRKLGEVNNEDSDDEDEDCQEGTVDSSASSSDFDEIMTFPTKPQVVVKKNNTEEQHAS